jgi:hypothetical protein
MSELFMTVPTDLKNKGDLLVEALVDIFSESSNNEERELRIDTFNDQIDTLVSQILTYEGKMIKITISEMGHRV